MAQQHVTYEVYSTYISHLQQQIFSRRHVECERKRGINLASKISGLEQMKDYNPINGDGKAEYGIVFCGKKSRFNF